MSTEKDMSVFFETLPIPSWIKDFQTKNNRKPSFYLGGPMTGYPEHNRAEFDKWVGILRAWGHVVWSPMEEDDKNGGPEVCLKTMSLGDFMAIDIPAIARQDACVFLKGWEKSRGCQREVFNALMMGKKICEAETLQLIPKDRLAKVLREFFNNFLNEFEGGTHDNNSAGCVPEMLLPGAPKISTDVLPPLQELVGHGTRSSSGGEVRVVSPTGGAKGTKLARFDLIPPNALFQIAEHYGKGCQKYAARNWERGYPWSMTYAALMRHAMLAWDGEDIDPETQSLHAVAVAWHALTWIEFYRIHPEYDDRPTTLARREKEKVS